MPRENTKNESLFIDTPMCGEPQDMYEFLAQLKEEVLAKSKEIGKVFDEKYLEEIKAARRNINWLFDLVKSDDFKEIVEETGPILALIPSLDKDTQKELLWPVGLAVSEYHRLCVLVSSQNWKMTLYGGHVTVNSERFDDPVDLYLSRYKLLMSTVTPEHLKAQIKKWLQARGVSCG